MQALLESSLRFGTGAKVSLDAVCERDGVTPFEALFSESTARAIVSVPRAQAQKLVDACVARGVPYLKIGSTGHAIDAETGEPAEGDAGSVEALEVAGLFTIPLAEADAAYRGTLPAIFG
ncbi:hypothetical protein GCM10025865_08630 [Paraoerskovia sediminicola]|uniref:PurM-like C-terminal domain-containing protein n=1 Tax=Paraoerskovia sediminicola TaxID=1138587 RepID=A0ABM8G0S7_9CELL|nr:hypothetical protein GCM10025865_08630 [Paraoerskovia sediminicola]